MKEPTIDLDPTGVIREAYRIEGITAGDCRTIFLDWALTRREDVEYLDAVRGLLVVHGTDAPDHPMTATLRQALEQPPRARRRGGPMGRRGGQRDA